MSRMLHKLICCLICLFLIPCITGCIGEKDEPEWYLQPGDKLPDFEVSTIDGMKVSSEDSYSSELIIIFFNTTCPDCQKELPIMQKQYDENLNLPQSEESKFICISREEGTADVERYWKEHHLTLPVSPQADRHIYSMFASIGIPRIFHAKNGIITKSE